MKIAFTTSGHNMSSPMDQRFGRAKKFLVYDTDAKDFIVIENESQFAAQGAGIKAAETVAKSGAKFGVTGECGPKAFAALRLAGIKVYSSQANTVEESLDLYMAGRLEEIH